MSQQRMSLSLSKRAERRARAMGRRVGSVSAYVEGLIAEDERREALRRFIDEHFGDAPVSPKALRRVREELGLPE